MGIIDCLQGSLKNPISNKDSRLLCDGTSNAHSIRCTESSPSPMFCHPMVGIFLHPRYRYFHGFCARKSRPIAELVRLCWYLICRKIESDSMFSVLSLPIHSIVAQDAFHDRSVILLQTVIETDYTGAVHAAEDRQSPREIGEAAVILPPPPHR